MRARRDLRAERVRLADVLQATGLPGLDERFLQRDQHLVAVPNANFSTRTFVSSGSRCLAAGCREVKELPVFTVRGAREVAD